MVPKDRSNWRCGDLGTLFCLIAIGICGFAFLSPGIASAQLLRKQTTACSDLRLLPVPRSFVVEGGLEYSIKARSNPPDTILVPGEAYTVNYAIQTDCFLDCGDILPLDLQHRAVLGSDRSRLDRTDYTVGKTYVRAHRCGTNHNITVTFTVPLPWTLGAKNENVSMVSMGACPPSRGRNCAGHTIKVRNAPIGEWKVAAPKIRVRTISGELPAGRPIPMSVNISNFSGKDRWFGEPGGIVVKQVYAPGSSASIASLSLPAIADFQATTVSFSIQPATPGDYSYSICLVGLNDYRGWPLPDICGPERKVAVGAPFLPPQPGGAAQRLPVPGANQPLPGGNSPPLPDGFLPPQQAVAPAAANCTGGRLPNAQGRCVCPAGLQWNSGINHCAAPQGGVQRLPPPVGNPPLPAGATPPQQAVAPAPAPGGQLQCRGGEVKGILCWCGLGRFPKALGGNVYQCQ